MARSGHWLKCDNARLVESRSLPEAARAVFRLMLDQLAGPREHAAQSPQGNDRRASYRS
jgi:hypothetical protein